MSSSSSFWRSGSYDSLFGKSFVVVVLSLFDSYPLCMLFFTTKCAFSCHSDLGTE
jgi:hypothetical protein